MMQRQLPHDIGAESALVGAAICKPTVIGELGAVDAADLYDPRCRAVWEAVVALYQRGVAIDEVTVGAELTANGKLDAIGGLAFVAQLALANPTTSNAPHYAAIVQRHARARRLVLGFSDLAGHHHGKDVDPDELNAQAQALLRADSGRVAGFRSAADRIVGEEDRRMAMVRRKLSYPVSFLNDYLRGLRPKELVLLGATSGAGKTQLATLFGLQAALERKRVFFFALEAEEEEIERRIKYDMLVQYARRFQVPGLERLNYPDWIDGACEDVIGGMPAQEASRWIHERMPTLHTFYRGRDFDRDELVGRIRALEGQADLIIVDHLHYVDDKGPEENENRAMRALVKSLRDAVLDVGIPVVAVAHLRKRSGGERRALVPDLDSFHGSSDLVKIATTVITLAPARDQPQDRPGYASTYVAVPKWRLGGACQYVALMSYDLRRGRYEKGYILGRLSFVGDTFEPLSPDAYPRWAKNTVSPRPAQR